MAQIKSYDTFQNVKDHVKRGRLLSKGASLTIASDVITVTDSYHAVAVESGSSDNLKTINSSQAAQAGQLLVLQAAADDKDIVLVKRAGGGGNISMAADITLAEAQDTVTLIWNGTYWNLLASATTATPS